MVECRRVNALEVLCDNKTNLIGEVVITAPAGVILDLLTGLLNVTPVLTVSSQVLNKAVVDDKVIVYGWATVLLTITGIAVPVTANYAIPLQAHVKCCKLEDTDIFQIIPKLEGTLIYGTPVLDPVTGASIATNLHLKVAYDVRVIVSRAEVVDVMLCPRPSPPPDCDPIHHK